LGVIAGCLRSAVKPFLTNFDDRARSHLLRAAVLEAMLKDPAFSHLYFDISWTEVAKYITATPEATKIAADLMNRYPDRFLFGTDEVAPTTPEGYYKVYGMYAPLWAKLTPDARAKVCLKNYERIFNEGRRRVRAWEKSHS